MYHSLDNTKKWNFETLFLMNYEAEPVKINVVKNLSKICYVSKWNMYGALILWSTSLSCENFRKLHFIHPILCGVKVLCYQYYSSPLRNSVFQNSLFHFFFKDISQKIRLYISTYRKLSKYDGKLQFDNLTMQQLKAENVILIWEAGTNSRLFKLAYQCRKLIFSSQKPKTYNYFHHIRNSTENSLLSFL